MYFSNFASARLSIKIIYQSFYPHQGNSAFSSSLFVSSINPANLGRLLLHLWNFRISLRTRPGRSGRKVCAMRIRGCNFLMTEGRSPRKYLNP